MARSTYKTFLMYKETSSAEYTKLIDIKEFPDLGGAPELLDTTTLSNKMRTYIPGVQDTEGLTFTANYTLADFTTLDGMKDTTYSFAVWFGGTESASGLTPTGSEGKFEFDGQLSVYVTGGGVNEVTDMTITIAPSTVINQTAT